MVQRVVDVVRQLAPRARPEYIAAFEGSDKLLSSYGLTSPLRLAHFLAQVLHETGGLTIERESGAYSASRIMQIFGVGKHSAGVTQAEARQLAHNGPELFERVYGLGNPRKAKELGNTKPGDGWKYRGNGLMQTTGREAHRVLGGKVKLGTLFEERPEAVTEAEYALLPALAEWRAGRCNEMADRNDIRGITRKINGGYNGFSDRQAWFSKAYKLLGGGVAWEEGKATAATRKLQRSLNLLGYGLAADGREGPETTAAVKDFQRKNGLRVDGIAGDVTLQALETSAERLRANPELTPQEEPLTSSGVMQGAGTAAAGGGALIGKNGTEAIEVLTSAEPHVSAGTWIGLAIGVVILAGAAYALWSRMKAAGKLPSWLGG